MPRLRVTVADCIRTIIARILLGLLIILLIPFALIILIVPQRWVFNSSLLFFCAKVLYWGALKCSLVTVCYEGAEHLTKEPSVIIANHQSSFDIPLVGYLIDGSPHLWLAWVNLMKSPLLRWVLPKMAVLVDMSTPKQGLRTLIQAINILRDSNRHVIIFPEGARFEDGKVHQFYGGFALIAKKLDRPVIPMRIYGVRFTYPPHAFFIRNYPISVVVGEPMRMGPEEDEKTFIARVRQWYDAQREDE